MEEVARKELGKDEPRLEEELSAAEEAVSRRSAVESLVVASVAGLLMLEE